MAGATKKPKLAEESERLKLKFGDVYGSLIESLEYDKKNAIELQEQCENEDYNKGREDAITYAVDMINKHIKP